MYCLIGANRGKGLGYNELYITRRNGSLYKIKRHGLQRHLGSRTRHTAILKGPPGREYVFISTAHGRREDGMYNKHSMYLRTRWDRTRWWRRYFRHVRGPWVSLGVQWLVVHRLSIFSLCQIATIHTSFLCHFRRRQLRWFG